MADKNRDRASRWYHANKDRRRAYNTANREGINAWERNWRKKNPEKIKVIRDRAYRVSYAKNPQKHHAVVKRWKATYPDRARALASRGAARRRGAIMAGDCTLRQWEQILAFYHHRCGQCGAAGRMTIDHFIPLVKGGAHDWMNVWPLCASCNHRKHATMPRALYPPHVAVLREALA